MNKILIIEDDPILLESLTKYLQKEGYSTEHASTFADANKKIDDTFAIVILDWMLPDGQGVDLVKEIRKTMPKLPIILLTARNELIDKIVGLEFGANDYLTKPFEPRELLARIRVQIRTCFQLKVPQRPELLFGNGISMNLESRSVQYKDQPINLTKMEFELLRLFLENPGKVFPRESLLNKVWGYDNFPTTRTVDNHIVQLRQKIESNYFETIRGIGYRFHNVSSV